MKANSRFLPSLAFAGTIVCGMSGASGATPLYEWNFDNADGSNTGSGTGGTLALDVGIVSGPTGYAAGSFTGTGVSGTAGDKAFKAANAWDNYWQGNESSPITNAAGVGNLNLSSLTQFTVTMWVNRNGSKDPDLLNIGSTTVPIAASNPGLSIGFTPGWAGGGLRVGINGQNAWSGDLWGAGSESDWVFMAIAYNGNNGAQWGQEVMTALYGGTVNCAVITGDTSTSARVAQNLMIHDGGYWNSPGAPSVGATATMFLANSGTNTDGSTNGFDGSMDDIRIYDSLLSVSEIETIRLSAIPEPSAAAVLGAMGALVLLRRRF